MRKLIVTAASAAFLAGTAIATLQAQETQGTEGSQEEIIKTPNANSATEAAPGQEQKSGEASSATEAAPGQKQQTGEVDAKEAAPGQVKKQDQATGEEQPKTNESAAEGGPGQKQKSDESTAHGEAPGQKQKSGETTAKEAAPGQTKEDQATDETKPSTETTGSIDIKAEQKTEITRVFREVKSEPVDIDIDVNVGVVVPRTVTLHRLPPRVVEIVPAYRDYEYFVLADGRIVIVEPATLKVVYILVV
ncbi:DUF1236 domain-containing protein [Mesorhizobium sp. YM1C-6-2]|uniref:DUF1236 domain-containing protein n=1 Tax=Mesorhizobium sp. YM1C-6-2 TaxID=1827501 RepID=UPI000EF2178C|nr:DUF1236 domain-containing protein [Mesorhizobium sp. YM1C-6-2]RLP26328.1 DUF1236 domain-containing protein [Mesorhizobium sp. YM1C-6-2]